MRHTYKLLAQRYGVPWKRRSYDPGNWASADVANRCLSAATACLHGLSEAAVLAAGYAPAIGFLHSGKPRSFVYDIADLWKLGTVVPEAFRVAARAQKRQPRHDGRKGSTPSMPGLVSEDGATEADYSVYRRGARRRRVAATRATAGSNGPCV